MDYYGMVGFLLRADNVAALAILVTPHGAGLLATSGTWTVVRAYWWEDDDRRPYHL